MGKRSGIFLTGTCTQLTVRYGETSSLRCEFCSSLLIVSYKYSEVQYSTIQNSVVQYSSTVGQ